MRLRPSPPLLALIVLALAWALPPAPASAATTMVRITATLEPAAVTIGPGDAVTWRNDDTQRHRIRSTSGPGEFDTGDLDPGESVTVVLSAQGTYAYRDERNKDSAAWWGSVTVSTAPPPPPGPTPPPGTSPTPTPLPPAVVGMAGRRFSPAGVTVQAGSQVTWRNDDGRDHTVTAAGAFDSGIMAAGATYARTFGTPGTYAYLCLIHPDMTGTVTVLGSGAPPPPGTAPTPVPAPLPTPVPASGDVLAVDFGYQPAVVTVDAGASLVFANRGAAAHTVTARDGSFASPLLLPGSTWGHTFSTPGTYAYLCTLHPEMAGAIQVRAPGGGVPPAAAPSPTPSPVPDRVAMLDFSFGPEGITVPAGTTVTWANAGVAPHTATQVGGGFNSGVLQAGATWAFTFERAGTYDYLCALHPQMTGRVTVTAAGAGSGSNPSTGSAEAAGAGPGASPGGAGGAGGITSGRPEASPATGAAEAGAPNPGPTSSRSPLLAVLAMALVAAALGGGLWAVRDATRRGQPVAAGPGATGPG